MAHYPTGIGGGINGKMTDTPPQGYTHRCKCGLWTRKIRAMPNKPLNQCSKCYTAAQSTPLSVAVDRMTEAVNADYSLADLLAEAATEIANLDSRENVVCKRIGAALRAQRGDVTRGVEATMAVAAPEVVTEIKP